MSLSKLKCKLVHTGFESILQNWYSLQCFLVSYNLAIWKGCFHYSHSVWPFHIGIKFTIGTFHKFHELKIRENWQRVCFLCIAKVVGDRWSKRDGYHLLCAAMPWSKFFNPTTTPIYRGIRPSRQDHTHERFSYSDTDSPMGLCQLKDFI